MLNIQNFLNNLTKNLLGKKAWGVKRGIGSFITLEFGNALTIDESAQYMHGEWHLWLYLCSWRMDTETTTLAACEDKLEKIDAALKELEGKAIKSITICNFALDTIFEFEGNIYLKTFSIYSEEPEENEHWMLFIPDNKVFVAGPGKHWTCEASNS